MRRLSIVDLAGICALGWVARRERRRRELSWARARYLEDVIAEHNERARLSTVSSAADALGDLAPRA
jgi:hypothetical protein